MLRIFNRRRTSLTQDVRRAMRYETAERHCERLAQCVPLVLRMQVIYPLQNDMTSIQEQWEEQLHDCVLKMAAR